MNALIRNVISRHLQRLTGTGTAAVLTRKVGGAFFTNVLGTAIAFGLQVLLARMLGAKGFGQYTYVLTYLTFFVLFAKLGLDTASLRFVPEYQGQQQWGMVRGFMRRGRQMAVASSVIMALLAAIVVFAIRDWIGIQLAAVFIVACVLLPFNVLLVLEASYLQAFKHIVLSQVMQVILRPLLLGVCVIGAVFFVDREAMARTAMVLNLVTTIIALAITVIFIRRALPSQLFTSKPEYQTAMWGEVAFPMLLITSFNLMLNQADVIMVGAFLSTTDAGIYSAVNRITLLIAFSITLVNSIVAPMISGLYSRGKLEQLQRMISYAAWGSLIVSVPLCIGIVVWGKPLLSLFGKEFVTGWPTLVILAISRLVVAMTGSAGYLMSMSGHHTKAAYILGGSALLNIALNAVLIPVFGMEGAAITSLITTALWSIVMVAYVKKMIGINATVFRMKGAG